MNGTVAQAPLDEADLDTAASRSDEDLLLAYCSRGDREAFGALVHRYERELYGYLRHYTGDAETAQDVFQQTFLQVHLKCDRFEHGRKVRPWLYTVATNQAIDYQRRNRRHQMVSLDRRATRPADEDAGALVDLLDNPEPDPGELAETAEQHDQLREALNELPEPTRQVVRLVYFQGLKYREAADILSIPVGTVKSRLHAAIHKLSDTLTRTRLPK